MRRVVWSVEAQVNLEAIRAYIGYFNPFAAHRVAARLVTAAESLADYPLRGRPASHGHRELMAVHPYSIRYFVAGEDVVIAAIRHGAREPRGR